MLAIVDYKAVNQTSVRRALEHLGIACDITADQAVLSTAGGLFRSGRSGAGSERFFDSAARQHQADG